MADIQIVHCPVRLLYVGFLCLRALGKMQEGLQFSSAASHETAWREQLFLLSCISRLRGPPEHGKSVRVTKAEQSYLRVRTMFMSSGQSSGEMKLCWKL